MAENRFRTPARGRFAPSPTGRMHAGNIFAALVNWLLVRSLGGTMVLRIEDLDVERSKPEYADAVMRDLEFLGLSWDEGPFYQRGRGEAYEAAFAKLRDAGLVYPCFCTRADLHAASAPHRGEKLVYAGTCRGLSAEEAAERSALRNPAMRLAVPECEYRLDDLVQGPYSQNLARDCGDYIIRRSDGLFAYQLAVVVDDAEQKVNCVVRGVDLLASTPQQIYLRELLAQGECTYAHVPLLTGAPDRRLSKRDRDAGLEELLSRFKTAEGILGHIAGITGLAPSCEPASCPELLQAFDARKLGQMFPDKIQVPWR